jgi:hypothetical protein
MELYAIIVSGLLFLLVLFFVILAINYFQNEE